MSRGGGSILAKRKTLFIALKQIFLLQVFSIKLNQQYTVQKHHFKLFFEYAVVPCQTLNAARKFVYGSLEPPVSSRRGLRDEKGGNKTPVWPSVAVRIKYSIVLP